MSVEPYLDLVTNQHRDKSAFIETLTVILRPIAANAAVLETVPGLFDIDNAVGQQLDVVGEWVGRSRALRVPLTDVYFSFGTAGLGFGEGTWKGAFDPDTGLVSLPDDTYRVLLKATIAANQWDGSIPGAYEAWATLFSGSGTSILIQDYGNMSMLFGLVGPTPDAVSLALLTGGYLALKPAGVRITSYVIPSSPGTPLFGFGVDTETVAGFGTGSWATSLSPT